MRRPVLSLAVVVLFSFAANASATTWYVATTGNDSSSGAIDAPFRTITKGASMARPGDTVSVRGGVYGGPVRIAVAGTSAARITVQSHPGEKAVIDGAGTPLNTDLVQLGTSSYLDFVGFEVRNSTRLGIVGWGAKNVRILNNTVTRAYKGGIYVGHDSFGSTYDITIDGNRVFNNVTMNETHNMTSGGWGQSISVQLVNRATITNNRVYENDGEGIVVLQTDNALVQGNEVSDSFSVGIYLDNAQHTTVDGNFVYSSGNSRYFRNGLPAAGIGTANESYSSGSNPLTNLTITNNIVVDTRWGFYYGAYENGGGLKNTTVANNTFYRAAAAMVWLEADAHSGNVVQNNIFFQAGGGGMLSGSASGTTFRRNNWYGGNAGAAASTDDILGDPRLMNASGRTAADYKLTPLSPAVDSGLALSLAVTTDYWRGARAATFDVGAHELTSADNTPPPAGDTEAPSAPSGFSTTPSTSAARVDLEWQPSTDNAAVTGYRLYRNGSLIATVNATTYTDASALAWSTTYNYAIEAFDAAGNVSAQSARSATTIADPTPAADTTAPTTPTGFWATSSTSAARMYLEWGLSTDNVAVTGYRIYRNGALIATVNATTYTDASGLAWSTTYNYAIEAFDAAGNVSAQASRSGTTIADPAASTDTIAPTMPGGFWVTPSTSSTRMYLAWHASADNVAVTGYRIYRDGTLIATVPATATTWTDSSDLRRRTTYSYAIAAFDAAGNESAKATFTARTKK